MRTIIFMSLAWLVIPVFGQNYFLPAESKNTDLLLYDPDFMDENDLDVQCTNQMDDWPAYSPGFPGILDESVWIIKSGKIPPCYDIERDIEFPILVIAPDGEEFLFKVGKHFGPAEDATVRLTAKEQYTLAVDSFSGGAHCCYGTHYFSIKNGTSNSYMFFQSGHTRPEYDDFDGDGFTDMEIYDSTFAYKLTYFAASGQVFPLLFFNFTDDNLSLNRKLILDESQKLPRPSRSELETQLATDVAGASDAILKIARLYFALSAAGQHERATQLLQYYYDGIDRIPVWHHELNLSELISLYRDLVCNSLFQSTVNYCSKKSA